MTDWFNITTGVRQGCVLSPLLYIIYMDKISSDVNSNQYTLNELIFADDQCLIYPNEKELQEHLYALEDGCHQHNMKISSTKTEVMKFARVPTPIDVQVGNNKINKLKNLNTWGVVSQRTEGLIEKLRYKSRKLILQCTN
jgi:hypothetical protein